MDRREALRKLGAAGAIAAGGSAVLSSNSVAFAASAGTCLAGIPGPTTNLTVGGGFLTYSATNNDKDITITITVNATCTCGGATAATKTYLWDTQPTYTLQVPNNPSGPSGYRVERSGSVTGSSAQLTRGFPASATGNPNKFQTGDQYKIGVNLTWQCAGSASKRVEARYSIEGTYDVAPTGFVKTYALV